MGIGDATPDYPLEVANGKLALSDADVSHGVTDAAETDVFALIEPISSTGGGARITGVCDADADCTGLTLRGIAGSGTNNRSAIQLIGVRKSGTGVTDFRTDATLFQILNNTTPVLSLQGNGQMGIGNATIRGQVSVFNDDATGTIPTAYLYNAVNNDAAASQRVLVLSRPSARYGVWAFFDDGGNSDWRIQWNGTAALTDPRREFTIQRRTAVADSPTMSSDFYIDETGDVGVGGTTDPVSGLHIPDGKYLQIGDNNAGAPSAGDCDADAELGRMSIDTQNFRFYICNGATRGWDYFSLTD